MVLYEKLNNTDRYGDYPENNLGERMRKQRNIKGFTAEELANLCGCSMNSIYAYESNNAKPANNLMNKIIDALDVDASYFKDR